MMYGGLRRAPGPPRGGAARGAFSYTSLSAGPPAPTRPEYRPPYRPDYRGGYGGPRPAFAPAYEQRLPPRPAYEPGYRAAPRPPHVYAPRFSPYSRPVAPPYQGAPQQSPHMQAILGLSKKAHDQELAAATGFTAEDALHCLVTLLPAKGGTALTQLGTLIGGAHPGGWSRNFSHLGNLTRFIEANPYYVKIHKAPEGTPGNPQPIVYRCDPESAQDETFDPAVLALPAPEEPQDPCTAEEAVAQLVALIPPGVSMQVSQLGANLGPGGFNGSKRYSHLARNLRSFLLEHPECFELDTASQTICMVRHAGTRPGYRPPAPAVQGPLPTALEAAQAVLAVMPPTGMLALTQLGTNLGMGGWKAPFGHLGTLRSFLENNPDLFTVDPGLQPAGGQLLVGLGPRTLGEVAEVHVGSKKERPPLPDAGPQ